jgi:NADH-quinone oxidoreductase subunit L
MGGLAKRMPRTFWTFLIGGLALSGFPLVTAGFWSKDEILAQAYEMAPAVFWVLAVAAGLTAFYTMRQICMTFLGQPRTAAAEHAPESVPSMTVPLMILAVFAVGLGWAGIPENLPVIGGLIPNWFHHFIISTIETGHGVEHATKVAGHMAEAAPGFVWQPLALGLTFGLGGLALGWLVYGRKPMRAGEDDRVEAAMRKVGLGWLHNAMRDRFYFDEIYHATFVKGSIWLANVFDAFDYGQVEGKHGVVDGLVNLAGRVGRGLSQVSDWLDANIVDGLVNLAGRAGRSISEVSGIFDLRVVDRLVDLTGLGTRALSNLSDVIDLKVVDGAVNGVGDTIRAGGRFIRPIQTGKVQNYLLLASLMVLALVATFFMILFLQI